MEEDEESMEQCPSISIYSLQGVMLSVGDLIGLLAGAGAGFAFGGVLGPVGEKQANL